VHNLRYMPRGGYLVDPAATLIVANDDNYGDNHEQKIPRFRPIACWTRLALAEFG